MARPPKVETKPVASATELFSEEELKALASRAREEYEAEQKKEAAEAFIEDTKRRIRQKALFTAGKSGTGEVTEMVQIDLAPHAATIVLDGCVYFHGLSYSFTQAQAQTIKDIMHRTWMHEREIGGANMNAEHGRRPLSRSLSPRSGV